jgi:hypothetical protein
MINPAIALGAVTRTQMTMLLVRLRKVAEAKCLSSDELKKLIRGCGAIALYGYAEKQPHKRSEAMESAWPGLSGEQRSELLAEAEKKRYERRRQERERFEAKADRLSGELRSVPGPEGVRYRARFSKKRRTDSW